MYYLILKPMSRLGHVYKPGDVVTDVPKGMRQYAQLHTDKVINGSSKAELQKLWDTKYNPKPKKVLKEKENK